MKSCRISKGDSSRSYISISSKKSKVGFPANDKLSWRPNAAIPSQSSESAPTPFLPSLISPLTYTTAISLVELYVAATCVHSSAKRKVETLTFSQMYGYTNSTGDVLTNLTLGRNSLQAMEPPRENTGSEVWGGPPKKKQVMKNIKIIFQTSSFVRKQQLKNREVKQTLLGDARRCTAS